MESEKIKLDKYESYYLLILKNWRNPDVKRDEDDTKLSYFGKAVNWIFNTNEDSIDKAHIYNIVISLGIKCLSKYKLEMILNDFNPYTFHWEVLIKTLEEHFASALCNYVKTSDIEWDYTLCDSLVSYDNSTFLEFRTKE